MNELEEKLEEYRKELEAKTLEELAQMEEAVQAEAKEADKEATEKVFLLKEADGTALKLSARTAYGNIIANFLGKMDATWQQALMLNVMVDFWKSSENEVKYPILDNTLRMLGQVQFKGVTEYAQVNKINEFFEAIRTEFTSFTDKLYDIANRHTAISNEIELRTAVQPEAPEAE